MLTFQMLWESHPTIAGDANPCSTKGKPNFPDQCAIRMGVALTACGVQTTKLPGVRHCWQHNKSQGHVLSAEELAVGLSSQTIAGLSKKNEISTEEFSAELKGKTGIIFFKDYWQRTVNGKKETFRNRSGDHIDLWNGHQITSPHSWARIHLRIGGFGLHSFGFYSDLEDSKSIWFWQVQG